MSDADQTSDNARYRAQAAAAGHKRRAEVLGDGYGHSNRDQRVVGEFDDLALRFAWGELWTRPGLEPRMRSAITIMALISLNKTVELELHIRAGLRNGLSPSEIKEILIHSSGYCGMPAANAAFRVAEPVLSEAFDAAAASADAAHA